MKKSFIAFVSVLVLLIGGGIYFLSQHFSATNPPSNQGMVPTSTIPTLQATTTQSSGTPVIGKSVQGRDITAYTYGTGTTTQLLFVGGIHGGYEWNTVLVAYNLMDYLQAHPEVIPKNITVTVVPVLNPDGLNTTVGTAGRFTLAAVPTSQTKLVDGRFNANTVDLNRNFDCDWKAQGMWQNKTVSGGSSAFSEPESQALNAYVEAHKPAAVVVWYSAAGGVYSSSCHNGVSSETDTITKLYASASGYPAHESFDFYATTGDMVNWLAKNNIPAISVLLTNHTDVEWDKNQAGVIALLKHYAN